MAYLSCFRGKPSGDQKLCKLKELAIKSAPKEVDYERFATSMLRLDSTTVHYLYCFKKYSHNEIFRFQTNEDIGVSDLSFRPNGITIQLRNAPPQTDLTSFDCIADKGVTRFFFKKKKSSNTIYQLATESYGNVASFGRNSDHFDRILYISNFPDDADHSRFFVYKNGSEYVYCCMRRDSTGFIYSGALHGARFEFGHKTQRVVKVESAPAFHVLPNVSGWSSGPASAFDILYMIQD